MGLIKHFPEHQRMVVSLWKTKHHSKCTDVSNAIHELINYVAFQCFLQKNTLYIKEIKTMCYYKLFIIRCSQRQYSIALTVDHVLSWELLSRTRALCSYIWSSLEPPYERLQHHWFRGSSTNLPTWIDNRGNVRAVQAMWLHRALRWLGVPIALAAAKLASTW